MMQIENTVLQVAALAMAMASHEAAHAGMAYGLGDPTAQKLGRLSLNPLRHIDPFGTVILPAILMFSGAPFLFGWAKPVPVDFRNLKSRHDAILVSIAGIVVNLSLAMIAGFLVQFLWKPDMGVASAYLIHFLVWSVIINGVLAVFNLLPFPPLDGGRIVTFLLPPQLAEKFVRVQPLGIVILFILIATNSLWKIMDLFLRPIFMVALGDVARMIQ